MSAVLTRPPSALFREEQNFAWWLYAALGLIVVLATASLRLPGDWRASSAPVPFRWPALHAPVSFVLGVGLPIFLVLCLLRMTTEVSPDACCITFGWLPAYRRIISTSEIRSVEIVQYDALREHGFWGIRTTRGGERVLTARGDRAVRLHLSDGSRVLIGTQQPDVLARLLDGERG